MANITTIPATPTLLTIPVELRLKIYESCDNPKRQGRTRHVSPVAYLSVTGEESCDRATAAAISLTCHQLHHEIKPYLYQHHHFRLRISTSTYALNYPDFHKRCIQRQSGELLINDLACMLSNVRYLRLNVVFQYDNLDVPNEFIKTFKEALEAVSESSGLETFDLDFTAVNEKFGKEVEESRTLAEAMGKNTGGA